MVDIDWDNYEFDGQIPEGKTSIELVREETLAVYMDMAGEQLARLRKKGLAPPHIEISTGKRFIIRYDVKTVNEWLLERDIRTIKG